MPPRSHIRLFVIYTLCFMAALAMAWVILTALIDPIRSGQPVLLLLPPLGGMALFHGLFPLLSKLRLGLEFLAVGGALVYGLGGLLAALVWGGLIGPGAALVFWLAGVFGPGWWILSGWAEKLGYFE